jgi:glyoxylase-like metal-dependent hydrolase (beta-lactamase superfamily II)
MSEHRRTRREILRTAVAGAAGLMLSGRMPGLDAVAAQGPAGDAGTLRLADDLFVLQLPGQENIVAHTGADGVVLVDGGSAAGSDAVMKAVAALSGGRPIQTLFNTHWHPEQTGLNETLGKAGKTIIAQENTRLWLTTDVTWPWNGRKFTRLPKIAQPNKTFYTTDQLRSGIRYGYFPDCAHTDGDLYVLFPKQNVLAVGGVLSADGWPVMDWVTGGWIGGIVGALQRVQALANEDTRIIGSRGAVLRLADVKTQYEMYATIYERLTTLLNRGRSPGEAVEAKPTKEFDAQMGNGDEFVRRAFESLWGYLSPDA